jgi:hypothetical protein
VGSLNGRVIITEEVKGKPSDFSALGIILADRILERGGQSILDDVCK